MNRQDGKINILYIIDSLFAAAGTEKHLMCLVRNLRKDRFNCSIVAFNVKDRFWETFEDRNMDIRHIPVARVYTLDALKKARTLRDIIKERHIDIVQSYHFMSDTYGVLVARMSGVKHVISSRRDMGFKKDTVDFLVSRLMDFWIEGYITVSDAVGNLMTAKEKIPRSKQRTIYNGVDLRPAGTYSRDVVRAIRKELGIGQDDFVVGTVAVMRPEKGYDIFFAALRELFAEIGKLKVIVVGSGPLQAQYQDFCVEHGISDKVIFTGFAKDVERYVSVFDVACVVSRTEGLSNALLEMMSLGKPVVATRVGGNPEVVTDGRDGILIPYDAGRLSDAIRFLYGNPAIREEMGRQSRRKIEERFTLEKMVQAHETYYESLCRS